jgi:hypothetical protein
MPAMTLDEMRDRICDLFQISKHDVWISDREIEIGGENVGVINLEKLQELQRITGVAGHRICLETKIMVYR